MQIPLELLQKPDELAKIIPEIRKAVLLDPYNPEPHVVLAVHELHNGNFKLAEKHILDAIGMRPDRTGYLITLASIYAAQNKMKEVGETYKRMYQLSPTAPAFNWNYANYLLGEGQFTLGWEYYKWRRIHLPGMNRLLQPPITNEYESCDRLVVVTEQGLGDTIQFIRYLPELKRRFKVKQLIVECREEIYSLLSTNKETLGIDILYVLQHDLSIPFQFDEWCSIMDVPGLVWLNKPSDISGQSYLKVNTQAIDGWKDTISQTTKPLLGINWKGSRTHSNDRLRSAPVSIFKDIASNFDPIILQNDLVGEELPQGSLDASQGLITIEYTAALMMHLKKVVTVDSMIAHLGGALGIPTLLLLPFSPEWRWRFDYKTGKTAWYDSVTVVSQTEHNNWNTIIEPMRKWLKGK